MPQVDLRRAKAAAAEKLPPGHPGRILMEGLSDDIPVEQYDLLVLPLIHALRTRAETR